jgi:hypothetical protein
MPGAQKGRRSSQKNAFKLRDIISPISQAELAV